MKHSCEEIKKVQKDFQFIVQGTSVSSKISKVDFHKSEFKPFSAIDNSHFKSESLSKVK